MRTLKIVISLILVLFVVSAFSAAPTNNYIDSYPFSLVPAQQDTITGTDTIAATDSLTLISSLRPHAGYEYILSRNAITGTGSDSVKIQVRVDAKDEDGNVFTRTAIDSMTAAAGENIVIPFSSTLFGKYFDVKLIGYHGNGGQVILNKVRLYMVRPVIHYKPIQF